MRKDTRWYLGLTLLSLAGLLSLQAYNAWIHFRQEAKEYIEEAQAITEQAVKEQVAAERLQLVESFELYLLDPDKVHIGTQFHWAREGYTFYLTKAPWLPGRKKVVYAPPVAPLKTPKELDREHAVAAFSEMLLEQFESGKQYQWTPELDEEIFFWYTLERLDSADLGNRIQELLQAEGMANSLQLMVKANADSADQKANSAFATRKQHLALAPIKARVTGVEEEVLVALPNPFLAVFRRSLGLIGGSLLIVLLAGFTFARLYRGLVAEKKLGELKEDFINNITHELQTPLATLHVALEAAEKHQNKHSIPPPPRDYLRIARQETAHLSGMIDHLLETRILGKDAPLETEATEAIALLKHSVEGAQLTAQKPLNVQWKGEHDQLWLQADPMYLEQSLVNLLDNALKYGHEKGVTVTLGWEANGQVGRLWVQDNGPGIAQEHQESIFDRFFRVPKGLTREERGLGLGLYFVKTALQRMDGDITVSSRPQQGTTFTITLPLATHENSTS